MSGERSRYGRDAPLAPEVAPGWRLQTRLEPAALYGANGIRIAPDGRLWICEGMGGRISACDTETGELTTVVGMDGGIARPDDLDFASDGTAYVTSGSQVIGRRPDGETFVLLDDVPSANGIVIDAEDRLYVDEFRYGGRLWEVTLPDPATRRLVAEDLDLPNACDVGPDGRLYVQNVLAGTVHAVDRATGEREQVADGLKRIAAVKFDPRGRLVATQSDIGEVTAIDLAGGGRERIAQMPYETIDNICFDAGGALYVSNFATGGVLRVEPGGDPGGRTLVPHGLVTPATLGALGDGLLVANYVSVVLVRGDGGFEVWSPWAPLSAAEMALAAVPIDGERAYVLTGGGDVLETRRGQTIADVVAAVAPLAQGATMIASGGDALLVAGGPDGELRGLDGSGAVVERLHTGQHRIGALVGAGGTIAAADVEAGTVVVLDAGARHELSGFDRPTGVALAGGWLYVAEHGAKRVVRCRLDGGERAPIAGGLPFGSPLPGHSRPGTASLLAEPDGALLVGADGDGSILRLVAS